MPSNTTARSKSIRTTNESLSRGAIWQSLDPRSIPARATFAPPEGMPALTRTNIRRQGPTRISPEFSTAFAGVHAYFSGICRLAAFCSVTPRAESLRSTCGTRGALVQERDRNQGRRPLPKVIVATVEGSGVDTPFAFRTSLHGSPIVLNLYPEYPNQPTPGSPRVGTYYVQKGGAVAWPAPDRRTCHR
jgi:hypothetical protein